jgi:hypothetical protein
MLPAKPADEVHLVESPPVSPPTTISSEMHVVESRPVSTMSAIGASMILPGLGQLMQRRFGTAALHFASIALYLIAAVRFGGGAWTLGFAFFNLWSCVDAGWWGGSPARTRTSRGPNRCVIPRSGSDEGSSVPTA